MPISAAGTVLEITPIEHHDPPIARPRAANNGPSLMQSLLSRDEVQGHWMGSP
jgi:hypothetical protein